MQYYSGIIMLALRKDYETVKFDPESTNILTINTLRFSLYLIFLQIC